MKILNFFIVAFLLFSASLKSQNLVTNGDFSEMNGSKLANWSPSGPSSKVTCTLDESIFRSAPRAVKIVGDSVGWRGWRNSEIQVEAGKTYNISFYAKANSLGKGTRIGISFTLKNASNENIGKPVFPIIFNEGGSFDWKLMEAEYTIPEGGAKIVALCVRLDPTKAATPDQTVWYDDVKVELKK